MSERTLLSEAIDAEYYRQQNETLRALLKEAGEALATYFDYPTDEMDNCLYCSGNYLTTPPSAHHDDCEWLQHKNRAVEIRKRIQEVLQPK